MRISGFILFIFTLSTIITLPEKVSMAQEIETVKIGEQEWMKYNLKTDVLGSICYELDSMNCERYGRLYFWQAALDVCPEGFRLPTDQDWSELVNYLGGDSVAGKRLKKGGDSGFDALFAGNYHPEVKLFSYKGEKGYYWSASSHGFHTTWIRSVHLGEDAIKRTSIGKSFYFSIRCIKID
jgi:uncharacterized protein (TIGR02145 family)